MRTPGLWGDFRGQGVNSVPVGISRKRRSQSWGQAKLQGHKLPRREAVEISGEVVLGSLAQQRLLQPLTTDREAMLKGL